MDKQRLTSAVTRYMHGDADAFNDIYELTNANLFVYAKSLMKDTTSAEDLLQNTYMDILGSISNLQEPSAFLTWSKRIMFYRSADHYRGTGREDTVSNEDALRMFDEMTEEDSSYIPEENLDAIELGEIVWDLIDKLPEQQRVVMLAFYKDEMTVADIAYMMGTSENTVKTRLFYGRKGFKELAENYEKKHNVKLHGFFAGPAISMLLKSFTPASYLLTHSHATAILANIAKLTAAKVASSAVAAGVQGTGTGTGVGTGTTTGYGTTVGTGSTGTTSTTTVGTTATGTTTTGTTAGTAAGTASTTAGTAVGTASTAAGLSGAVTTIGAGKIAAIVLAGLVAVGGTGAAIHHFFSGGSTPDTPAAPSTQQETSVETSTAQENPGAETNPQNETPGQSTTQETSSAEITADAFAEYFGKKTGLEYKSGGYDSFLDYDSSDPDDFSLSYYVTGYDTNVDGVSDIMLYSTPGEQITLSKSGYKVEMTAAAFVGGKIVEKRIPITRAQFDFLDVYWLKDQPGLVVETFVEDESGYEPGEIILTCYTAAPDGFKEEVVLSSYTIGPNASEFDDSDMKKWQSTVSEYLDHNTVSNNEEGRPFKALTDSTSILDALQLHGISVNVLNRTPNTYTNPGDAIAALVQVDADNYVEGTHGSTGSDRGIAGYEFRKADIDGDGVPEVFVGKLMGGADIPPNPEPGFLPYYYMAVYTFKDGHAVKTAPLHVFDWGFDLGYANGFIYTDDEDENAGETGDYYGIYRTYQLTDYGLRLDTWYNAPYQMMDGKSCSDIDSEVSSYYKSKLSESTNFADLEVFTCSSGSELAAWING